jgi:hypothetical protein
MPLKLEQQVAQRFIAPSFLRPHKLNLGDDVPKYMFHDLLPIHISYNATLESLQVQHTYLPTDLQGDSILSAPPPWQLHVDRLIVSSQNAG